MTESSFESILEQRGELIYTNVGNSMYPLIKPRDLLVIKKVDRPLRRLDIPLYQRDNGQYVLHRIIKKRKNDYLICGDNRVWPEEGITDRHILGILTDVIRNGETISVYRRDKRVYAQLLVASLPLRRSASRIKNKLKKR